MEAKELMIRDWAQSTDLKRPAQYSGRSFDFQPLDGEKYRRLEFLYEDVNCGMHIPEKRIYPIPLTAEILHKNGFKLSEIPDEYYNDFEPSRFWEYSTDTKESLNINIKIDENVNTSIDAHNGDGVQMLQYFTDRNILYVHELQHALRLVDLDEMADNLKVE